MLIEDIFWYDDFVGNYVLKFIHFNMNAYDREKTLILSGEPSADQSTPVYKYHRLLIQKLKAIYIGVL